jgi:hypothetical protein
MDLIWPSKDTVTVEIPIAPAQYTLPDGTVTNEIPIEFFICKKREMKTLFTNLAYLKNFVAPVQPKNFKLTNPDSNSLIVLAESDEVANYIVDS